MAINSLKAMRYILVERETSSQELLDHTACAGEGSRGGGGGSGGGGGGVTSALSC